VRPTPNKVPRPPPPRCECGSTLERVLSCPQCDSQESKMLSFVIVGMLAFAFGLFAGWLTVALGWVRI